MGTSVLVSEQEYLTTSYDPDCEYDEGEILERNVGELPHGTLQLEFGGFFRDLRRQGCPIRPAVETRIRIAPRKYRIPDVFVYKEPAPRDPIPSTPPFIAIEILLPEDRMSRRAVVYTATATYEAKDGVLRTEDPAIAVPLTELFQALDD
jgi:Uma2 family endonuclease